MSEITALEVQSKDKSRANIYLDGEFYAGISVELCVKHQLKKGMEVDEEFIKKIVFEDDKGKALSKAVKYMGSAIKTSQQIRDYLKKKEYNSDVIDYVIDKMIEYKYLDDVSYCKAFIATYSNKYGKLKLISALKSKGIKDSIIDEVFLEETKIQDSIDKVAEKYLKNKIINNETLIKLNRFLYSRGYEFDKINECISKIRISM